MQRYKFTLFMFAALFAVGLFWSARQPLIAAYARSAVRRNATVAPAKAAKPTVAFHTNESRPSPGQLSIFDPTGKPAGMCPLQHTDVKADIAGFVAKVTVTQRFANPSPTPIEAVYTFPLPADAAVDDMTMTIGQRVIRGEIKRREEARQIYEAARTEGKAASLLDQERPNIFTQSVANIMPGDAITITISYVNLLKYDDGRYEFAFPMVVGPRYMPNGGGYTVPGQRGDPSPGPNAPTPTPLNQPQQIRPLDGVGLTDLSAGRKPAPGFVPPSPPSDGLPPRVVTDADKITPPITPPGTRAGHDISLSVHLDAGVPLDDVMSVLHAVNINREGANSATVELKNQASIPNKDFILRYTVAGKQLQSGLLTYAPRSGDGYFTLIVQPPMAPPQSQISPKEMIFVIDQTGSQGGWPIKKSKETMSYCLKRMNPGDTFQLIGFNTEVMPCFRKPVPNTPDNVQKALKFLEPIEGNGGTDILKSVDYALSLPDDSKRLRIVCYLTDGYVGNDMQVIDYVAKHRRQTRMFPIGIGNGVNRFLIDGMAKEGRGASDYVTLDEPGNEASQRFYNRIASPLLLDVGVEWGGLSVADVYPKQIPDVFSSGPIILKGRYTQPGEGDIVVKGLLRGQPWSQRIHVTLPATDPSGSALETLWARQQIEEFQSQDWMGAQSGKPDPGITEKIIATALKHRLMSQYTSFVAVEERVINTMGQPRKVDVPVEMPDGVSYEGIFGEDRQEQPQSLVLMSQMTRGASRVSGRALYKSAPLSASAGRLPALNAPPPPVSPTAGPLSESLDANDLVSLQDGSNSQRDKDLTLGRKDAYDALETLKPDEKRHRLAAAKLDPRLAGLADLLKKEGKDGDLHKKGVPNVMKGRVEVQVWFNAMPTDALKTLKTLGVEVEATLMPGKLLLITVPVERLDDLLALTFVRRVEPPKFTP